MRFLRETVPAAVLLAAVFALVAVPVLYTVEAGLHADAGTGQSALRSLAVLIDVLTGRDYLLALRNAAGLAGLATVLALIIGVALALLLGRTDIPGRAVWEGLAILPLFLSPFTGLMAWIALATPGTGFVNRSAAAIAAAFGRSLGDVLDIWTFDGAALTMALCFSPLVALFMLHRLRSIDPALEEAARLSGVAPWRAVRHIALPLCRPAILAALLLVFALSVEIYAIPGFIGSNAGFTTLPWRIFEDATAAAPPRLAHAAAAATLLLAVVACAVWLQRRVSPSPSDSFDPGRRAARPLALGVWRFPALAALSLYVLCAALLPAAALLLTSLMKFTPGPLGLDVLTLKHYLAILTSPDLLVALFDSLLLAVLAGAACAVLGLAVAAASACAPSRLNAALGALALLPLGVPGLVYGLGLSRAFQNTALSGSIWLLLIAFVAKFLPYGFLLGRDGLRRVSPALVESARLSGAGAWRAAQVIALPLLQPALRTALLFVMLDSVREMSASVLLNPRDGAVLSILAWHYMDEGDYQFAAALGVVQTLVLLALLGLARLAVGRRLDRAVILGGGR
jgi:iron(III) transport system permease protein